MGVLALSKTTSVLSIVTGPSLPGAILVYPCSSSIISSSSFFKLPRLDSKLCGHPTYRVVHLEFKKDF